MYQISYYPHYHTKLKKKKAVTELTLGEQKSTRIFARIFATGTLNLNKKRKTF